MIENPAGVDQAWGRELKYYTKPDEAPVSHPADVLERKKEKPDALIGDLVKEADAIVQKELEERRKQREAEQNVEEK